MKATRLPQELEMEEGRSEEPLAHPEKTHKSFVLDRLLVKWINPLITHHTPLEESDVWEVSDTDMSVQRHSALFSAAWTAE